MRRFVSTLVGFILVLGTSVAEGKIKVGDKFPKISLNTLGTSNDFEESTIKGKVVLVDFWGSDCAPCRLALPELNSIFLKFRDQKFVILGINVDEDPKDTAQFLTEYKVEYPLIDDQKHELIKTLGVSIMPTSYLLDDKGIIRYIHRGFKSDDPKLLTQKIEGLLSRKNRIKPRRAKK